MSNKNSIRVGERKPVEANQAHGRWLVLTRGKRRGYWACRCECGTEKEVVAASLYTGKSQSCGCWKIESARNSHTHGQSCHLLYQRWRGMRRRCQKPKATNYGYYGGRGIGVCERWESFGNFLEDMGPSYPGRGWSIDRYPDKNGDYEPSNCRWATSKQQGSNARNNILIEWNGTVKTLAEWAVEFGVNYSKLWKAYRRHGKEKAFRHVSIAQ